MKYKVDKNNDLTLKQFKRFILPSLFFIILVILAEVIIPLTGIKTYLLPTPSKIAVSIMDSPLNLLKHCGVTLLESILGFGLAIVLGMCFAIIFIHSRLVEKMVYPYVVAFKAIPLIALAPILTIWFDNSMLGKVVMSCLICFFPIVVSATTGLRDVSPSSLDLMHSLYANWWQILIKVRLPAAAPHIFAALKVASTLSIIGSIVAELTGADKGIGYLIIVSSYRLDTPAMFAAIIVSAAAGILFFFSIAWAERKVLNWHQAYQVH